VKPLRAFSAFIGRLLTGFFDQETWDFTLSFLRDLWKSLLVIFGLTVISHAIGLSNLPKEKAEILESIHFYSTVATFVTLSILFLAKVFFSSKKDSK
jgi:hypothetical protein